MKNWILVAVGALVLTACQGETGPAGDAGDAGTPGAPGAPGLGYLPLESSGVVGFVRDTAGEPVIGATVYLVPNTDIPTAAVDLSSITAARASAVDEPLEDTIAANGAGYARAVTDANGIYRIATVPAGGRFYLTVVPAATDADHLPGGSLCRSSLQDTALVGKQLDVKVSTRPSATAQFVGPSVCLRCHGVVHELQTLHMNGIRVVAERGPLQSAKIFPDAEWNAPLAKFAADTTLYYYAYDAAKADWKLSETNPGTGVSFSARLFDRPRRRKVQGHAGQREGDRRRDGHLRGRALVRRRHLQAALRRQAPERQPLHPPDPVQHPGAPRHRGGDHPLRPLDLGAVQRRQLVHGEHHDPGELRRSGPRARTSRSTTPAPAATSRGTRSTATRRAPCRTRTASTTTTATASPRR